MNFLILGVGHSVVSATRWYNTLSKYRWIRSARRAAFEVGICTGSDVRGEDMG